ncbi:MAG: efflux RND transporter permease subunit [Calditrichaeota bacterium]|nr:efflux RND transporter permease subunit [Calditrichota bacterium]
MNQNNLQTASLLERLIRFCLNNRLVVVLLTLMLIAWGILVAPFAWDLSALPRDPVPVDAIPDLGENQQIVFTPWAGHSPQDIEDQVTYPLTTALLGIPGVKTVRSFSMFGFSSIYIIFKEEIDFYWSRSRVAEKLNSLSSATLPEGVQPRLGPDATALGQVFWYTLEGQDAQGRPTGGWDLQELRSIQDWYVRYSLMSAEGVSEVASVGGFVQEYQIDVNPDAMRVYGVSLDEVFQAVRMSNLDVGARTIEINQVEYVIRGVGFIKQLADLENSVVKVHENVPIYIKNLAHVTRGPALRRGALDKAGAEAVGGVVITRYGENPLQTILNVKEKIAEISPGLPSKTLADGTVSQVVIVPFYDRSGLIYETLDTLDEALVGEILITIIVVILLVLNIRGALLISGLLPLAVLMTFIAMKYFGVDANIVALSGIAIAIGTMVDMGIVIVENIIRHLEGADPAENRREVVARAASEVGGAVLTAAMTTIVGFLPVFALQAAEGKLFRPLAFTKTYALVASAIIAITILPALAQFFLTGKFRSGMLRRGAYLAGLLTGIYALFFLSGWIGVMLILLSAYLLLEERVPAVVRQQRVKLINGFWVIFLGILLAEHWLPLGPERGLLLNLLFVLLVICGLLFTFWVFIRYYGRILHQVLDHKVIFLSFTGLVVFWGLLVWLGFSAFFGWLPRAVQTFGPVSSLAHQFPGLGKEFMPPLDEGAFLYMPTTMPHASIGEALDVLQKQDAAFGNIPEVQSVVGKIGRAETAIDPAPISMIETVINYHSQYIRDAQGRRQTFRHRDDENDFYRDIAGNPLPAPDGAPYTVAGKFLRDDLGRLIPDPDGLPFRQWRPALDPDLNPGRSAWPGIRSPDDIWDEIVKYGKIPGTTSAPKLQPIATRIVMLQSGMRAPMGIKVKGPDLQTIEAVGLRIEALLKQLPAIEPATVLADRIIGKPYLEIEIDREAIARYGIRLQQVQNVIEVAIGGKPVTTTVEGRERYPVRVRYQRELRNSIEALERTLVPAPGGAQIPLVQLASINYQRGPQMIKSEDTFLTGYVVFDKRGGYSEVEVVEQAQKYLEDKRRSGELEIPAGVSYRFTGSYENQVRSEKRLMVILPLALAVIFLLLYFQFKSVSTTALVFSSIAVAWSGGFIMIWLYGQPWFLDFSLVGIDLRELFRIHPFNLSVAIWVGFLALFGIASDDGVLMATYLEQSFAANTPGSVKEIRAAVLEAGLKRIRPAVMTTATTILALLPVLTASGRGSDIMIPMAIPVIGGMVVAMLTWFIVPVLYCLIKEIRLKNRSN